MNDTCYHWERVLIYEVSILPALLSGSEGSIREHEIRLQPQEPAAETLYNLPCRFGIGSMGLRSDLGLEIMNALLLFGLVVATNNKEPIYSALFECFNCLISQIATSNTILMILFS